MGMVNAVLSTFNTFLSCIFFITVVFKILLHHYLFTRKNRLNPSQKQNLIYKIVSLALVPVPRPSISDFLTQSIIFSTVQLDLLFLSFFNAFW